MNASPRGRGGAYTGTGATSASRRGPGPSIASSIGNYSQAPRRRARLTQWTPQASLSTLFDEPVQDESVRSRAALSEATSRVERASQSPESGRGIGYLP